MKKAINSTIINIASESWEAKDILKIFEKKNYIWNNKKAFATKQRDQVG